MSHLFQTDRLGFRAFQRSDAERLSVLINDIDIARWIGPMPHPYTLDMAHEYLDEVIKTEDNTFAIELNGDLVGAIAIGRQMGFWLAKDQWGQGLITEAATAMIDRHFAASDDPVRSGYHEGNAASARVHEKLGFVPNGTSSVYAQALGRDVTKHDLILDKATWACRR